MQHRTVANVAVALDHRVATGEAMHYAGVLQVGALLQDDASEITAQRGQRPYITVRADDDVTDQHGAWVNIGRRIDDGGQAVESVAGHGVSP